MSPLKNVEKSQLSVIITLTHTLAIYVVWLMLQPIMKLSQPPLSVSQR